MAGVWVAEIERFGYDLIVVERSKKKALRAISDEYKRAYFKRNREYGDLDCDTIEEMENDEQLAAQYVVWTSVGSALTIFLIAVVCRSAGLL